MLHDCCQRKRRKVEQPNSTLPSIHVHNHMAGSSAHIHTNCDVPETSPTPPIPPTITKRSASPPLQKANIPTQLRPTDIIDLTISDDDDNEDLVPSTSTTSIGDGIRYPGIPEMLAELHMEFEYLNFPQYEGVLMENGFVYVSQLVEERVRQQLQDLGLGVGVVNSLLSRAERVIRRTQKLKRED